MTLSDNPLVRAVARVPATVRRKLLVAYVGTVVLLVVLGVLGLQTMGASNGRVVNLGHLQQRLTTYQAAQSDADEVRQLLDLRAATYLNPDAVPTAPNGPTVQFSDSSISNTLDGLPAALGQLSGPSAAERAALVAFRSALGPLQLSVNQMSALDKAGQISGTEQVVLTAHQQAISLEPAAQFLVTTAQNEAATLIADNASSYQSSQELFVGVAVGSIIVALLIGLALSLAIIGPVQQVSSRMEAIAAGDFSAHVDLPNRDELGRLASNLNRMNDELARLYRELESASRHKSEFLANMSHELRTPLNAIIGFSQVLKQKMAGDLNGQQEEYLDDVLSSGQHLLALINDVLDIAKVESGSMDLELSVFPLADVVTTALTMLRERATRNEIELVEQVDPAVGLIEADERKLKQIMFNLISNAVKFTSEGGTVTVTASAVDSRVEISVSDTGVGISAEDQALVFEEFYQTEAGRSQEGTGLGLPLTRKLVELHGGQLSVRSEVGRGSTFRFTLPRRQRTAAESGGRDVGDVVPA